MALFTDGAISGLEELVAQDSQLTNVANVEGIDVTQKAGLAQCDLGIEITTLLSESRPAEQAIWRTAQPTLDNVVVTPPLKLWHTFRTLEMVYGDAYSSQLNDRYAAKRDQFHERAFWAYERLLMLGVGIVWAAVPRAEEPQVVGAGGSLTDGTYFVAVTWVNSQGEEGAPSVITAFTTAGSTLLVQPARAPACAAGWNVYVGIDPTDLSKQNDTLAATGHSWLQPNTLAAGNTPGWGQPPNYMMTLPRRILRG
jgi:hypothetical protein